MCIYLRRKWGEKSCTNIYKINLLFTILMTVLVRNATAMCLYIFMTDTVLLLDLQTKVALLPIHIAMMLLVTCWNPLALPRIATVIAASSLTRLQGCIISVRDIWILLQCVAFNGYWSKWKFDSCKLDRRSALEKWLRGLFKSIGHHNRFQKYIKPYMTVNLSYKACLLYTSPSPRD